MLSIYQIFFDISQLCKQLGNKFVIHEHQALKAGLHYDVRLEHDCSLKSWATRKLPELVDQKTKRIGLFQTKDHALSYYNFEGELSDGYGKGMVSIWDNGSFDIIKWDQKSKIIDFKGKKLKGKFVILHLKKDQYLMFRSKIEEVNNANL